VPLFFHDKRMVGRLIGGSTLSAIAPTAVAQLQFVSHPTGTLFRTFLDFRMTARIKSGGGTPPPPDWVGDVFPTVTVQFDPQGFPASPADPGTTDERILQIGALKKRWRGPATSADLYSVDYWMEPRIDTSVRRIGTAVGGAYPTVTAYLWTNDQSVYWGGSFYDHRSFSYQAELSVIFRDTS
jgi:hypothetical protein